MGADESSDGARIIPVAQTVLLGEHRLTVTRLDLHRRISRLHGRLRLAEGLQPASHPFRKPYLPRLDLGGRDDHGIVCKGELEQSSFRDDPTIWLLDYRLTPGFHPASRRFWIEVSALRVADVVENQLVDVSTVAGSWTIVVDR